MLQTTGTPESSPQKPSSFASDDDTTDLLNYVKAVWRYIWPISILTVCAAALSIYWVKSIDPQYRATASIQLDTQHAMPISLDELTGADTQNKEYLQTQFQILRGKTLARRVIEKMGLYTHPEFVPETNSSNNGDNALTEEQQRQLIVENFRKSLQLGQVKNTKIFNISFQSTSPELARDVANAMSETYIESNVEGRTKASLETVGDLSIRLEQLREKLEASQHKLVAYREEHGLVDIQSSNGLLTEHEIGIITGKLIDAEAKMTQSKLLFDEVEKTRPKGMSALLSLPIIDSNELVRRFKIDNQDAQLRLNELLNRYGDKHPKVVDANSLLQVSQANLRSQVNNIVDAIGKEYNFARQTVDSLRDTLNKGKQGIQTTERSRIGLSHLEKEVELNQKIYDAFRTRIREVNEAENTIKSHAQIIEYADTPLIPVSPKKKLIVMLATLLTFGLCSLLAIAKTIFSTGITSISDVEDYLGLKMLGIVPLRKNNTVDLPEQTEDQKSIDFSFDESIKTIRTGILLEEANKAQQVIMVTSALPGEGKSTLTRHLACALAKVENVLLLECDLRRPSLQETFQLEQSPGLIQLLLGEAKFADCINLGVRDNLDVMTAGGSSMNPLELLGSPRFYHLMAQMEKRYDRILIDSAPVQAVSDALLLGQVADNVLFAVKANTTPARVAARAVERLRDASVSVSGAVVTQVKVNNSMISYDNFDYEGYYDYYGYSTQESTAGVRKKKKKAAKNKEVKAA